MAWCDECSEYRADTAVVDGTCAVCNTPVGAGTSAIDDAEEPAVGASAPWHFWVVVVLLALYLGWRVVALILWLFE